MQHGDKTDLHITKIKLSDFGRIIFITNANNRADPRSFGAFVSIFESGHCLKVEFVFSLGGATLNTTL